MYLHIFRPSYVSLQDSPELSKPPRFPMVFLCISIHLASPMWLCGNLRNYPSHLDFLWFSYVCSYISPLLCGSAVVSGIICPGRFPVVFHCIYIHFASPMWVVVSGIIVFAVRAGPGAARYIWVMVAIVTLLGQCTCAPTNLNENISDHMWGAPVE